MVLWPDSKKFAFSVVDDTDCATLDNGPLVYDFLYRNGFRTTKTVWLYAGEIRDDNKGSVGATCEDKKYLDWVQKLKEQGFEIGLHSISWTRSTRDKIIEGLDMFKSHFGADPTLLAQHTDRQVSESIYWGAQRLTGIYRCAYKAAMFSTGRPTDICQGHLESSPYFWGDICNERVKYVRNFVYRETNTLKMCPVMPYHDPQRPYVQYWFASSDGGRVDSFNFCLSEARQEQLENEGGACIMYTHFGKDFVINRTLNKTFKFLMEKLARRGGWFVPVSRMLDYLLERNGPQVLSESARARLERRWLWEKVKFGSS